MENKLLTAAKKVVDNGGLFTFILFVLFFPISLLYFLFRVLQEIDHE